MRLLCKSHSGLSGAFFSFLVLSFAVGQLWPSVAAPMFADVTTHSGIGFRNYASKTSHKYLPEAMTGGVAVFDYDGDGLLDIFFVNGAALRDPMPPGATPDKHDPKYWNRLYRNNGDGTFTDKTEMAGVRGTGYGMGVAVGDYDNDGHPDLYVTNVGHNLLYHNNGDGTFVEVTSQAGVGASGWSAGAAFVDYDRDGLLDLVVSRYLEWNFSQDIWCGSHAPGRRAYCEPDLFRPVTHVLYHNEGHGRFRDVSAESGIASAPGKGLGIAINDYDRDGWPDLLIANDSIPQQLFHNLRNGRFEEVAVQTGAAYDEEGRTFAGMGVDFADYNNDGWPDIFVNALANQRYALFRNVKGTFEYVSDPEGLSSATRFHSGWGVKFFDYDNDGWKDLFVGQGHVMDNIQLTQPDLRYLEPALLLHNRGGKFSDVSGEAGLPVNTPRAVRGVAFGDWNNDGRIDIVMNCNDSAPVLLENRVQSGNHWLIVDTVGRKSNRDGIGAQLKLITPDGREQYAVVSTASSYLSASDKRVHFGLGRESLARSLEIDWPGGAIQKLSDVKADRILKVMEPQ